MSGGPTKVKSKSCDVSFSISVVVLFVASFVVVSLLCHSFDVSFVIACVVSFWEAQKGF